MRVGMCVQCAPLVNVSVVAVNALARRQRVVASRAHICSQVAYAAYAGCEDVDAQMCFCGSASVRVVVFFCVF